MFPYRATLFAAAALIIISPVAARAQDAPAKEYDMKAEALLQKAADRLKTAPSFSAQVTTISRLPATNNRPANEFRNRATFRLQKPNRIYQESVSLAKGANGQWTEDPKSRYLTVSDGKTGVALLPPNAKGEKTYRTLNLPPAAAQDYGLNFPEFFDPKISDAQQARDGKAGGRLVSLKLAPDETFAGVPCSVVEEINMLGKMKTGATAYGMTKIYVGKKDGILRGYHTENPSASGDGTAQKADTIVTNVVAGGRIPASAFAVNLTGYKKYPAPKRPALLAAGTMAPDFTVYDKDGMAVKLSDLKGKVVVLDFWATWCGPCMASLPHTTKVAKKTAAKGVVVFAVNVWDKKEEFDKWLPEHPEYASLKFAIDTTPEQGQDVATKLYHVSGIPTQYIIDRNGKIVTSFVGFGGPTNDLENAIKKADGASAVAQK